MARETAPLDTTPTVIECISEAQPWAHVTPLEGGPAELRPMKDGERCIIPRHQADTLARRNPASNVRHVTILGSAAELARKDAAEQDAVDAQEPPAQEPSDAQEPRSRGSKR